jgi:hypothetical protein
MKILLLGAAAILVATGLTHAQERFSTQESVVVTKDRPTRTQATSSSTSDKVIRLRVGEVVEVFSFQDEFGVAREAFFVPTEGTRVVQVLKERHGRKDQYYLKGRGRGRTAGGIVLRSWLDASGFKPKSVADEVRIQAAIKARPIYIVVE